jgi:hypothetical protein
MKTMTFKNRFNSERFICDDVRQIETIDSIEYLIVRRPGADRRFLMRKDALERVKEEKVKLPQ